MEHVLFCGAARNNRTSGCVQVAALRGMFSDRARSKDWTLAVLSLFIGERRLQQRLMRTIRLEHLRAVQGL